jgi:signal transduction histidine kinase
MPLRIAPFVAFFGACVSFLVALAFGITATDALTLVGLAGSAAVGIGIVGAVVLHFARGRTIAVQTGIIALTSVVAQASAMFAASGPLFSASNADGALAAVLIVAGTVGVLITVALGIRVDADRRSVVEATRQVGRGDTVSIETPATEEFADVANEVERMGAKLDESLSRERSLDRSRRELVAWVSHDLRTPLARLRAVVEALEDRIVDDPDTIRAYYRTLDVETMRLSKLIDDLLELSRISAGALELTFESLPIAELVSDVVASASEVAERKGVTVDLQIEAGPHAWVSSSHIERALGNLLDNAIRHTARGDAIAVRVAESSDFVRVTVEDSCGGIPPAELARLNDLEPGSTDLHEAATHAGLGVTIARGLVEAHSGRLSVANTSEGCCFTIELPRQSGGAATISEDAANR